MSYDVKLTGGTPKDRQEVESYLQGLPDLRLGAGKLLYTDPDEDVTTEIQLIGDLQIQGLDVLVPIAVSRPAAERIAALCAGLANRFGWRVQDGATGTPLAQADLVLRFTGASPRTTLLDAATSGAGCCSISMFALALLIAAALHRFGCL